MQTETWQILGNWALAALVYPGMLFGLVLSLVGDRLYTRIKASVRPGPRRTSVRGHLLTEPVSTFLKLLGRVSPSSPGFGTAASRSSAGTSVIAQVLLVVSPVLALALLPFPASPLQSVIGPVGDLLILTLLLALSPVSTALMRSQDRGPSGWSSGQEVGRLATGLFPTLIALAALVQAQGNTTQLARLLAAPETGVQFLVRVLAGVALLIALPWWSARDLPRENAAIYTGTLLQRAALAAFWSSAVLPAPGELGWAAVVYVGGALAAYVAMHTLADRWAPAATADQAARRVWVSSVPMAVAAILAALWFGG